MNAPGNDYSSKIKFSPTILKETQLIYNDNAIDFTIYSLLDKLIDNKEIDLYYYLVNQVSIVHFSSRLIEISSGNNKEYNVRLERIISNLVGQKTKITLSNIAGVSLKYKLIEDLKQSQAWAKMTSIFPGCEILDIIHKNG